MLARFKVKNFRSIVDLEMDFSFAEGKAPNGHQDLNYHVFLNGIDNDKKSRVVPCLGIFGANASGKTNVLKAMQRFRTLFIGGWNPEIYEANLLNKKYKSTAFEVEFFSENKKFNYFIEYDNGGILRESLQVDEMILFNISNKMNLGPITKGSYTEERLKEIYKVECQLAPRQIWSFLYVLGSRYVGLNEEINRAYSFLLNKFKLILLADEVAGTVPLSWGIRALQSARHQKNRKEEDYQEALNRITKVLQKFDFDIQKMTRVEEDSSREKLMHLKKRNLASLSMSNFFNERFISWHKDTEGKEIGFDFLEESNGSRSIAGLIGFILAALETGGVIAIDELDRSLHPLIVLEIVRLFKSKKYNKGNAQLLFTTHTVDLMEENLLRTSEIALVRKTLKSGSLVSRFSDFNIRQDLNFRKNYLSGSFSGIPFPYV